MKILIGTPIHISKDYAMERWLENVSKLEYPADLLLVDNSPGLLYVEKVKRYCKKYGVINYKIEHFEFKQGMDMITKDERIEMAQEIIRRELLSKDYDAWFSWECDQIIPTNALDELIKIMKAGNFMMVIHNSWERKTSDQPLADFGVALISRECLEKYGLLLQWVSKDGYSNMTDKQKDGDESWFKKRVFKCGGNYTEVYGVINPIYHLDK